MAASGGLNLLTANALRDGMYIIPVAGSTAAPDQLAPPVVPGRTMVPSTEGGVNSGPVLNPWMAFSAIARISGVKSARSFTVTPWYSNGAGFDGIGCVGDAFSPGTSDAGTGRS